MRDDEGRQHYSAIGAADDMRDADGTTIVNFAQAQERARTYFANKARDLNGHAEPEVANLTVEHVVDEYLANRSRQGSKGVRTDIYASKARIIPSLGKIEVSKLTTKKFVTGSMASPLHRNSFSRRSWQPLRPRGNLTPRTRRRCEDLGRRPIVSSLFLRSLQTTLSRKTKRRVTRHGGE
jgi:hypothetical protein